MIRKIICYTVLLSDSGCKNKMLCYVMLHACNYLQGKLSNFQSSWDTINLFCSSVDRTRMGHVLGQPQRHAPYPERHMSPASTSILRMLLHMSMYLSSLENPQVNNSN